MTQQCAGLMFFELRLLGVDFMRRSCKVIANNEWSASSGNEIRRDRHGYLEKHVRDECKASLPTFCRLGEKWSGFRNIMYRIVIY